MRINDKYRFEPRGASVVAAGRQEIGPRSIFTTYPAGPESPSPGAFETGGHREREKSLGIGGERTEIDERCFVNGVEQLLCYRDGHDDVGSRDDENLADALFLAHAPECFPCFGKRVAAVDNRSNLTRFKQLPYLDQVFAARLGEKECYLAVTEYRDDGSE